MKSLALWYETKENNTGDTNTGNIGAELHVNWSKLPRTLSQTIWEGMKCKSKWPLLFFYKFVRFIDFGILIDDCTKIKSINFYFPFLFKKENFEDLGSILAGDSNLLSALFNEYLTIQSSVGNSVIPVKKGKEDFFQIYTLGNDFRVTPFDEEGVKLTINIPKKIKPGKTYLRFRLKSDDLEKFCYNEPISFSFLQSSFVKIAMVDFRLNDIREIEPKVIEKTISEGELFNLKKIHFFFLGNSRNENIFFNKVSEDCRLLDASRWEKYLKGVNYDVSKKVLSYHWKQSENDTTRFGLLLKTTYTSIKIGEVIMYLIGIFLFGVLINLLSNWIINNFLQSSCCC